MGEALSVQALSGVTIRLTAERWEHIRSRHPELAPLQSPVLAAIQEPDVLHEGHARTIVAVKKQDSLYLIVIYREADRDDGFVVTAYLSRDTARGRVIWQR